MGVDDTISTAGHGHNRSAQQGVEINPDPVLDVANEHHHPHVHHGQTALPAEKDDMVFAKSTDSYAGDSNSPDYKVHQMPSNDEESGGVGEVNHAQNKRSWGGWIKRMYARYKIVFHFAIWAVWTA